MLKISDNIERKFVDDIDVPLEDGWEIETDTGFRPLSHLYKTIPYDVYHLKLENNLFLDCADTHIIFNEKFEEVFVCELKPGEKIQTKYGIKKVISVSKTEKKENMFDVTVEHSDHRFYSADILSHNTQTSAAYFCWWLIFNSDQMGAILANKAATARNILGRIQLAYENLPMFLKKGVVTWNKGTIELDGNIKLTAASTSSTSIRGDSLNILLLDEFAHVSANVAEDFWTSAFPTLSSGKTSKVIITSTPNGFNLYYKIWHEAKQKINGFNTESIHWTDIPGRDEAWKNDQLTVLGEDKFNQEYGNEFLGSSNTLISQHYIKLMTEDIPLSKSEDFCIYQEPIKLDLNIPGSYHHNYLVVVDPSEGTGNDDHAIIVFDISEYPIRVVAKFQNNTLSHLVLPTIIEKLAKSYNNAYVLIETNNNGQQVADSLYQDLEYENIIIISGSSGNKMGVKTNKSTKRIGCSLFKDMVENQKLLINDIDMKLQISSFVKKKTSWAADSGHKDDLVMCCVLLSWFSSTNEYKDITDNTIQSELQKQKLKEIRENILPFGFIDNGLGSIFGEQTKPERAMTDAFIFSEDNPNRIL